MNTKNRTKAKTTAPKNQPRQLAYVKALQGNLVRDPVLVRNGALFTVANHNGGAGPNYIPVSTWGSLAEEALKSLRKGALVELSGSLRSRQAKTTGGDVYTEVSVRATKITLVTFDEKNQPIKTPLHEANGE